MMWLITGYPPSTIQHWWYMPLRSTVLPSPGMSSRQGHLKIYAVFIMLIMRRTHNDNTMFNFKYYLKDNWEAFHGCSCNCFLRKLSHLLEDKMRGKNLSLIWYVITWYVITWNTECNKKVIKMEDLFLFF